MDWLTENKWYVLGGVALVGAGIYGYKKGWFGGAPAVGGFGCLCGTDGFGHSGRTTMRRDPQGRFVGRGHYRSSTGRWHRHV